MAVMSATLANGGTCPITLDPVIKPEAVRDVLSLLHSCGFYEYSGQFAFKVKTKIRRSVEDSTILHKLDAEFCLQCSLAPEMHLVTVLFWSISDWRTRKIQQSGRDDASSSQYHGDLHILPAYRPVRKFG